MPFGSRRTAFLLRSATLVLLPAAAQAQSTGLEDLVGARAGQAENALRARGYDFVRAEAGDDRRYAYWWSQDRRLCVVIATMDGRYSSVSPTPAPDCGRQTVPTARPAPDVRTGPPYPEVPPAPPYDPRPARPILPSPPPGVMVDGRPVDLGLVCFSDGQKPRASTTHGWTWNPDRDRYEYGPRADLLTQPLEATLTLQLWEGGGRIRLPRALIPPITSRGDHGWWDLTEVALTRERITARYRLNSLNKPAVNIDRRSGRIIIQGTSSYSFRGECELMEHGERRRF
jgi:hypothetical protein